MRDYNAIMIRGAVTVAALLSVAFFPWPVATVLALAGAYFVPLLPLATGAFADILYYTGHAATVPWFTVYGLIATLLAYGVRSRIKASIID